MTTKQKNFRLPTITTDKLDALIKATGLTEVQVIIIAIDRLTEQELKKQQKPR